MTQTTTFIATLLLVVCGIAHGTGLSGAPNPADIREEGSVWFDTSARAASTFRPLKSAAEDRWDSFDPRDGNNMEMLFTRSTVGFSKKGWSIEYVNRQEAIGLAQKDTLDIYRSQLLNVPVPGNKQYAVDYTLSGFEAQGLTLGRSFQSAANGHIFRLGIGATLLDARRFKYQQALGNAAVQSDGSLRVAGSTVNDDTSINTATSGFIGRYQNQSPTGSGYSIDVGLHYVSPQGVEIEWSIADAFSEISWTRVPEITLSGSSAFNGQFPGGHKVLLDLNQTLIPKHTLTARVPFDGYSVQASASNIGPINMFNAGISKELSGHWNVACDYDFYFNSVGLTVSHPWFEASLRTDNLNVDSAHALSLRVVARLLLD